MRRAFAIGAVLAVIALVLWLWRSVDTAPAAGEPAPEPSAAQPSSAPVEPAPSATPVAVVASAEPAAEPEKLDPMSDEFYNRFIEVVPHRLSRQAVECYNHRTGSLHRNQKLVLLFDVRIRSGQVSIHDVRIKPPDDDDPTQNNNSLNDPALESCFIQKVARTTWRDDSLPDYEWPDTLVIRPERSLKKHWKSNLEYVGEEAPDQPGRTAPASP